MIEIPNPPDFLTLGEKTAQVILPLFSLFKDENLAPALASSISGFALALCALFLAVTAWIRFQLWRRTRLIRKISDKAVFIDHMVDVERLMLSSSMLRHSWQAFRETLLEPLPDDPQKIVRSTVRPNAYFNMAEAGLRFGIFRAMPNLLVGVGLLLTFIGLVSALYFTTEAIKVAADLTASQVALRDLLHAASFKFYTSIAGLGGSIVLTLTLRYGTSTIEKGFDTLALTLERNVVFVTTESIAYDHYKEAQEQTRNLRLFNTEVALSVARRIEEALAATLPQYLAAAMEPIGKSLNEVADKLTSMNEGAIGEMAGSFVTKLQGATGDQMQALASTLQDLRSSLDGINSKMNESGSGLADSVSKATQEMRAAIGAMTHALTEVTAGAERGLEHSRTAITSQVESAVSTLEKMSLKISDVLENAAGRVTSGSEQAGANFAAEIAKAADGFHLTSSRTAAKIEEAVASISQAAKSAGERVADETKDIGHAARAAVVEAGEGLANSLVGISDQLTAAIGRLQAGLDGAAGEMKNTERGIAAHVGSLNQLSATIRETETAVAGTANSMREASAPLTESSRVIATASRQMAEATANAEKNIAGIRDDFRELGQVLGKTHEATAQQWKNYEERFRDVDASLSAVLKGLVETTQSSLDDMSSFVQQIDRTLNSAVEKLGGGIEELTEFADSMEKATASLNSSSQHRATV